jgi:hypothetical protein
MCSRRRAQLIEFGARASLRAIAYIQVQEVPMALINIKDLPQSDELDRRAMLAIVGGARAGARPTSLVGTTFRSGRVVDYPPGFIRDKSDEANGQRLTP